MKIVRTVMKKIAIAFFLLALAGVAVFITAGLIPEKNPMTPAGVKQEQSAYVPMKDGVRLAVRITLPSDLQKGEKVPAIMETTRYVSMNKGTLILNSLSNLGIAHEIKPAINTAFEASKYAFVRVDERGSGASFGTREMELSRQAIEDMGQVIDWIARQDWSNGKVGTYGISYSGNTSEMSAALENTALLAAAPLYPDFNVMSQSVAPGGIRNEKLIKDWNEGNQLTDYNKAKDLFFAGTAPVDGDWGGKLLAQAVKEHNTLDIYTAIKKTTYADDVLAGDYLVNSLSPFTYKDKIEKSGIPMYVRIGWMDSGTVNGAIERFLTYSNDQTLVIGPWSHAGHYQYDPFLATTVSRKVLDQAQADEVVAFFDQFLKADSHTGKPSMDEYNDATATAGKNKAIRYYTFGEGKWKTTSVWPVEGFENKTLYFAANGALKDNKPAEATGSDSYRVDFTATTGETTRWRTNLGGGAIFYPDRSAEDKKLLTYTSEELKTDVEITGIPEVILYLSSTATDGAFYVYLEDVAPDGKVTYITEGQLRALHRKITTDDLGYEVVGPKHSFLKKDGELLKPGEPTEIKIGMQATSVLLKKSHRIRIAIAGHDTSNFVRIPESGTPVLDVQRNSVLSSCVQLPMKQR